MSDVQRPPWVLVIELDDDVPPIAADLSWLREFKVKNGTATCGELSERILNVLRDPAP